MSRGDQEGRQTPKASPTLGRPRGHPTAGLTAGSYALLQRAAGCASTPRYNILRPWPHPWPHPLPRAPLSHRPQTRSGATRVAVSEFSPTLDTRPVSPRTLETRLPFSRVSTCRTRCRPRMATGSGPGLPCLSLHTTPPSLLSSLSKRALLLSQRNGVSRCQSKHHRAASAQMTQTMPLGFLLAAAVDAAARPRFISAAPATSSASAAAASPSAVPSVVHAIGCLRCPAPGGLIASGLVFAVIAVGFTSPARGCWAAREEESCGGRFSPSLGASPPWPRPRSETEEGGLEAAGITAELRGVGTCDSVAAEDGGWRTDGLKRPPPM